MQKDYKVKSKKQQRMAVLGKVTKLTLGNGKNGWEMNATRLYS